MRDLAAPPLELAALFSLRDRVVVVPGGTGALGGAMARGLVAAGARVAILGRRAEVCERVAGELRERGGQAVGVAADALDVDSLRAAQEHVESALGPVNGLVNAAGGNAPGATTAPPERTFFDLETTGLQGVFDLNVMGAINACQVFGRGMAERGEGSIVNVASMAALRPLTRVPAYGAAKGALVNFTQWLAVTLAQEYGEGLRVNALAPGFFSTEQNRFLLRDAETGEPTPRAQAILAHTPMRRFGAPDDLIGPLVWLLSPASAFVTGAVIPVDGGFSAFAGV
jgi:NAD(P)-dependent dehydrogenase (short-subunit alcohol dehydrogenase family)